MNRRAITLYLSVFLANCSSPNFNRTPSSAPSTLQCSQFITKLLRNSESFWHQADPIMVDFGNGIQKAVRFSHDSEITHADVFRTILKDPKAFKEFEALVESFTEGFRVKVEDLAKHVNMSPKQVQAFYIRKGVKAKKSGYMITDLNPNAFDLYFDEIFGTLSGYSDPPDVTGFTLSAKKAKTLFAKYKVLVNKLNKKNEHNSVATQDLRYIELVYNGSEESPLKFSEDLVGRVWKDFPKAASHLHIGIPAELSSQKLTAVSRAIELRIIFRLAESIPENKENKLAYSLFSSLVQKPNLDYGRDYIGSRGVIKVSKNRFNKPYPSHDLEIRQYGSHAEGLNNLSFAAELTRRHKDLRIIGLADALPKASEWIEDPYTSNLFGALSYAKKLLELRGTPDDLKLAKQFSQILSSIKKNKNQISLQNRKKVASLLNNIEFEEVFSEDLFFK